MNQPEHAWITGIGLVSSLGEGAHEHWRKLSAAGPLRPIIDPQRFAPYAVHPLAPLDFSKQIPRTTDQRQMERWQRIGVYAAGLALADAELSGNLKLLDRTDLCVAAGNGERDLVLDAHILATVQTSPSPGMALNQELTTGLRPTPCPTWSPWSRSGGICTSTPATATAFIPCGRCARPRWI